MKDIKPKVAFSATPNTSGPVNVGPYSQHVTLVYDEVLMNIGNGYDPKTGIFTAPVKGVYYFIFVVFNANDLEDTATNSVSLLLEEGDQVYLELMEKRKVYSDSYRRSTFSGHLLFTM
ncbi:cerebellin-1-like [Tachysurus ichikawai]